MKKVWTGAVLNIAMLSTLTPYRKPAENIIIINYEKLLDILGQ